MWLFTNRGFLSIVENRDNPDELLVRARYKGDIEAHFGGLLDADLEEVCMEIVETNDADYRFRVFLPRKNVAAQLHGFVNSIDYTNFKNSCSFNSGVSSAESVKSRALFRVWDTMKCSQEGLANMEH